MIEYVFFVLCVHIFAYNKDMKKFIHVTLAFIIFSFYSQAQDRSLLFDRANDKAKKRETSRWSLSEWLAQKERNKLMDLWLSMNSPSPYEYMVGASYINYQKTENPVSSEYTHLGGELELYAKIFGLSLEYENKYKESENDLTGLFNLRILGNSIQSTHLILHYGQRTRTITSLPATVFLRNQLAQVSLQMYLNSNFGIKGFYRYYLPFEDSNYGKVTGQLTTGGVFIEFQSLRIYGEWFEDIQKNSDIVNTSLSPEIKRTGIRTGLEFYF